MEDNSSSDDEIKDSPLSPKLGGKKLKLNDGSSQDSLKETAPSSKGEKDENVDSGVSADKSESISSDERAAGTSTEPSNEFVDAGPSCSSVRTLLLNFRRSTRSRNYRKRKTPDRDSDSNDSSRDSDDLSAAESEQGSQNENVSHSEAESEDMHRIMATFSDRSSDGTNNSGSESNDTSYSTDDHIQMQSGDTDSDEDAAWNRSNDDNDENDDDKTKTPSVLNKQRPKHNYLLLREIINREMGLTFPCGKTAKTDVMFEQKFYGSLHAVYRLKKLHQLHKHKGCVNSINFHPEGHLLASGSDDTNVVIWDWARNAPLSVIKTGHKSNVFQSKFLHLNSRSQLNIVTCARDGQVRLLQCPPSGAAGEGGASVVRRRLASHSRAAHKLHVCASEPHVVVSAGEDGVVMQCDVRAGHGSRLFQVKDHMVTIPLYSVAGHPLDPKELLVAGRDKFVRIYDRRKSNKPIALYCPSTFEQHLGNSKKKVRLSMMHLTCAVYNHDGTEILGSYNDEDVYLFDTKNDVYDKENPTEKEGFTHRYSGHRNSVTFKGVAFFGPKSQYIVSGSDCSNIYIWEKNSEAIVQWMKGDHNGVVNCIEPHPRCPVMATSGLDNDIKVWIPRNHKDPDFDGLERTVRKNLVSQLRSPLFNDFLPQLYSAWRGENRLFSDDDGAPNYGNIEFDGNVCSAF
ncbi:DDB1- and CUL4-associated factor 8 [Hyposmocoma kahamanoa]|uniref:DDB1- and CUL4-associated factor 8 n=1 Tax=Hyposmocoma kahamanoa TaxID=1477025 RepID=UPI000E6D82F0|nr:DDB1- and CUL4-associated factor 8 [Hyposmocoma kahamanoa]